MTISGKPEQFAEQIANSRQRLGQKGTPKREVPAVAEIMIDEVLDDVGVAELVKCSPRQIRALVKAGRFLAPARIGASPRWLRSEVLAWLRSSTGRTLDRGGKQAEIR